MRLRTLLPPLLPLRRQNSRFREQVGIPTGEDKNGVEQDAIVPLDEYSLFSFLYQNCLADRNDLPRSLADNVSIWGIRRHDS